MAEQYAQQNIILTYQIFCVLNPWSLQGHMTLYFPLSENI